MTKNFKIFSFAALFILVVFGGCSTTSSNVGVGTMTSSTQSPAPSNTSSDSSQKMTDFKERLKLLAGRFSGAGWVHAKSCQSKEDALQNLVDQIDVTVNAATRSTTIAQNMNVSHSHRSVVDLSSGENLRGLVVKQVGSCYFVAIDKRNATSSYKTDVRRLGQTIGKDFAVLDNPRSSSVRRYRAALNLKKTLGQMKEDHDTLALLTGHASRLTVTGRHMREMTRALSFAVSATEVSGWGNVIDSPGLSHPYENTLENDAVTDALTKMGLNVVGVTDRPAFKLHVAIKKAISTGPVQAGGIAYRQTVVVTIQDTRTGKIVQKRAESTDLSAVNFGPINEPLDDPSVVNSLVVPAVEALSEKNSDPFANQHSDGSASF